MEPIPLTYVYDVYIYTQMVWSCRPAVFFSIRADGLLDIWDFFLKQNDPVLSLPVSETSLTSFRIQETGRVAAVGARDGSTAILQLADSLVDIQPNEKQALTSVRRCPLLGLLLSCAW